MNIFFKTSCSDNLVNLEKQNTNIDLSRIILKMFRNVHNYVFLDVTSYFLDIASCFRKFADVSAMFEKYFRKITEISDTFEKHFRSSSFVTVRI